MSSSSQPDQTAPEPVGPTGVPGSSAQEGVSFEDHFTQPTLFYRSLTPIEQAHIAEAFTFELGKCFEQSVRERELAVLANVDADLCAKVAAGLGLPAPEGEPAEVVPSPVLSQIDPVPGPIAGRKVGIVVDNGADLAGVAKIRKALMAEGAEVHTIAPAGGFVETGHAKEIVERTFFTARSIEFDAVLVADGVVTSDIKAVILLQEAFRHCKPVGGWGTAADLLAENGVVDDDAQLSAPKVDADFIAQLTTALGLHRVWSRAEKVMASAAPPVV